MSNPLELNDYKDALKEKYGYTEDFAETISIIADDLINHYGEEYKQLIRSAIQSCKYVIRQKTKKGMETVKDTKKKEKMLDNTNDSQKIKMSYIIPNIDEAKP